MLAWPGWSAELDGKPLSVTRSDIGLLTVTLPAGASGTVDLTYRPPGLTIGLLGAGLGSAAGPRPGAGRLALVAASPPGRDAVDRLPPWAPGAPRRCDISLGRRPLPR